MFNPVRIGNRIPYPFQWNKQDLNDLNFLSCLHSKKWPLVLKISMSKLSELFSYFWEFYSEEVNKTIHGFFSKFQICKDFSFYYMNYNSINKTKETVKLIKFSNWSPIPSSPWIYCQCILRVDCMCASKTTRYSPGV